MFVCSFRCILHSPLKSYYHTEVCMFSTQQVRSLSPLWAAMHSLMTPRVVLRAAACAWACGLAPEVACRAHQRTSTERAYRCIRANASVSCKYTKRDIAYLFGGEGAGAGAGGGNARWGGGRGGSIINASGGLSG